METKRFTCINSKKGGHEVDTSNEMIYKSKLCYRCRPVYKIPILDRKIITIKDEVGLTLPKELNFKVGDTATIMIVKNMWESI